MRKFILFLALLCFSTVSIPAVDVFSTNAVWRFLKGYSEASSPTTAWRLMSFNDGNAGFTDALAPFWYGDVLPGGTQLTNMQNQYSCIFLRRTFMIGNAAQVTSMRLRAKVDDGFIAWINGVEVARTNVGTVDPTYQTGATNALEPPPLALHNLPNPATYLVNGANVIAIQAFNTTQGSSDFGFDSLLEVTISEVPAIAPTIVSINPPPGSLSNLGSISVTFSEPVTGLDANDLLINGVPGVTNLTFSGNTATFRFAQPLFGTVLISWAAGHNITDLATPANSFNAAAPGATWQYSLLDTVPPAIADLHPPAGLTVRSIRQIEVTFSEAVQGLQAADLLINGQPATNLTFNGTTYLFQFPSPPAGPVSGSWAAGHGIADMASTPNAFAGGSWTYVLEPGAPLPGLVINEFLAANVRTNGLTDEDGELQDWIEILNRGTNSVNLSGWGLSDDPDLPGLWTFPARTLAPGAYLVVFASGKDRRSTNPADRLHTNFKLGTPGEHLALYTTDSPRILAHGFTPYPEQRNDISYGYDPGDVERYFASPSPGGLNPASTIEGVVQPVHVNVKRGHFSTPFDLVASCPTAGAELRYTTDGSEPTESSPLLPASLRISTTTLFRVAGFKPNFLPSLTLTHSYFFNLSPALRSLPVLSIVTSTNALYGPGGILGIRGGTYVNGPWEPVNAGDYHNPSKHGLAWERPTSAEWIVPEDNSGFQIDCGIRVQGSDWQRPRLTTTSKFSFRLYFRNDYGPGRLEYPLFPLSPVSRFDQLVLRAGFNEQGNPFIRDEYHRRLSHDMGDIASHGNVAVVFVNGVYYSSSPWYNPAERVHEEFFQEHLGGGDEWDVVGPTWAQGAGLPGVIDGDRVDFQNMVNYVRTQPVTDSAVYQTIARRLDLTNFADYCILNSYAAMGDWPANNWRAGKDRGTNGVWRFVVWDAEWGMGIYDRGITINSFTQTGGGPNDSGLGSVSSSEIAQIYDRLRASQEFRLLWADRIHKHFYNGGALTGVNLTNRFNQLRDQLQPLMGSMDTELLTWARDRQAIYFGHMQPYGLLASSNAPVFSQFGGRVPFGFGLSMTSLSGTIYYTTNGSDPRTAFSGAISTSAMAYTGTMPINHTVTLRARSWTNGSWSAMTEATFTAGSLGVPLRISEIMYNPPGGSLYEYIELQNTGGAAVDLSGLYFDGLTFMFKEGTSLAAGARLVLGSDTDTNAWKAFYPGVTPAGWFNGNLNNAGERLSLYDRLGRLITSVDYKDGGGWPAAADGGGKSLELLDPNGNPDEPANWQASAAVNGSPGAANSQPPARIVELNELMAENYSVNHAGTFPDWIELRNPGASPVSLTGWSLTDDGNSRKFVFPATTLPSNGYLVVWCDATTNTTPGLHTGFNLDRQGETVSLYDASTNRIDAISFGFQLTNYSIGRIAGKWTLNVPTTNAVNTAATLAPAANLSLNEWLANPAAGDPDWLELYNRSATAPISLQGVYLATRTQLHRLGSLSFLPPLGFIQLFADEGTGPDHLSFKLAATGDSLTLSDPTGGLIQTIAFGAQTESVSRGRLPDGTGALVDFVGSVSPAAANYVSTWTGPWLNEVLARNKTVDVTGQVVDFIELINPGAGTNNLSGLSLSVNSREPREWTFPPGATLGPGAVLLIKCDGSQPVSTNAGNYNLGESLDGESGGVYLFNPAGQLVDSVQYGPQVEDLPIGLVAGSWCLLSAASPGFPNGSQAILGQNSALRLNEWMANPASGADWFEIYNTTNRPVNLGNISFSDDPSLVGQAKSIPVPLSFIGPAGFVKWIADADPDQGLNHVNFSLDAAGDSILLYATNTSVFTLLDSAAFGAESSGISKGSLPDGAAAIVAFPNSPTPGESNYRLLQTVVINEALAHTDPPLEDAIELHNPTALPVNIGGWFLSNSRVDRRKYQIPAGTTLAPGGYKVIYEYQFNNGTTNAFTLNSAHGDEIWLSAASANVETGDRAGVAFGAVLQRRLLWSRRHDLQHRFRALDPAHVRRRFSLEPGRFPHRAGSFQRAPCDWPGHHQ